MFYFLDGSSGMSPITFSGGGHGGSSSSPSAVPSPPQFLPGELLQVEATNEDGGYESETQEKGAPQPGAPLPGGGGLCPGGFLSFQHGLPHGSVVPYRNLH